MKFYEVSLPTAAENLALDEALLEEAEAELRGEAFRLWESAELAVIVGRASRRAEEVRLERCQADGIPVLRRCSGGAAVVIGPGCLMYTAVLSYDLRPQLRPLEAAHQFVLSQMRTATASLGENVTILGTSDLAIGQKKFSGNSLRCKRGHFLYHGTLLYDFPIENLETYLRMPPRRPSYREDRQHGEFVTNLQTTGSQLREAVQRVWDVPAPSDDWPQARTSALLEERYAQTDWHTRL